MSVTAKVKPIAAEDLLCVDAARAKEPLRECVRDALDQYFRQLDGFDACDLFDLVMSEVEAPLLDQFLGDSHRHAAGRLRKDPFGAR